MTAVSHYELEDAIADHDTTDKVEEFGEGVQVFLWRYKLLAMCRIKECKIITDECIGAAPGKWFVIVDTCKISQINEPGNNHRGS